jgi:hypothetical protein
MVMTVEVALALLAASIPLAAMIFQCIAKVTPVQFVRLETEFIDFRGEVRRTLSEIKSTIEKYHDA